MSNSKLAVPQLAAVKIDGMTRSSFILRSTLAAGAVYGGAAVGPFVKQAMSQENMGDIEILNFALTLEVLENTFYEDALQEVSGLSSDVQTLAEEIQSNEAEHVDTLTATIEDLGGEPVEAPKFDFGDAFQDEDAFLELAQTFEDTGVSAYNGAAPMIEASEVLEAAGSIVQIEARHAALVRLLRGESPAPTAFDESLEQQEVLDAVMPFIEA